MTQLTRQTQEVKFKINIITNILMPYCVTVNILWQVKGIMSQNMDLMMQRGEKLEHGLEKAGDLAVKMHVLFTLIHALCSLRATYYGRPRP